MSIRINMKLIKPIILIFFYLLFFPVFNNAQKIVKLGIVDGLSNENTISFTQDRDGFIWIGTGGGGLNRYDKKTNSFKYYKNDPKHSRFIKPLKLNQTQFAAMFSITFMLNLMMM